MRPSQVRQTGLWRQRLTVDKPFKKRLHLGLVTPVLLGLAIGVHALRPLHSGDVYLRDAGIAIRNASSSGNITILSDSSYVLYYAQVAHPHRLGVVSNTAQPIPAEWIAMSGAAGSEELSALSLCIQQEGHKFWRDFERSPGTPGERMVRVWRKKRTQPSQ